MKKHTYRTILIVAVLLLALAYIYPTVGWMLLSEKAREDRLKDWAIEDAVYKEPNYWHEQWESVKRWTEFDRDKVINLGLDLQGGIHMIVGIDKEAVDPDIVAERLENGWSENDIWRDYQDRILQTIRRRIAEFEAQEPVIQTKGNSQVEIQLPGEKDVKRAIAIVKKTAFLTFQMAAGRDETDKVFAAIEQKFPQQFVPFLRKPTQLNNPYEPYQVPPENIDNVRKLVERASEVEGLIPEDKVIRLSGEPKAWSDDQMYRIYLLDKKPAMTGEQLENAVARQDTNRGANAWMILFQLNAAGGRQFGEVTEANINRAMAIVVDDVVESAPVIQSKITTSGQITGDFSRDEARDLSIALSSGSMPVRIREDFTGVVGATLGADSVRKGVSSAMWGLAIVILFMMVYYRFAGVVATLALAFNAILVVAALAYFNATLTLPGIAGLILTIGMAVDANVLIFERIREEIRNGKSIASAIDSGYARATVTILDANVTTLIAAAVLIEFGTGPIEGFAITLSIGVCASVFAALIVSRAIFDLISGQEWFTKLTMMSLLKPEMKIRFLSRRSIALTASAIAIAIGMGIFGVRGTDNFGVDFTSGTTMVVNLETDAQLDVGQVRTALASEGFADPTVTTFEQSDVESKNRFFIRLAEELQREPAPPAESPSEEAEAPGDADGSVEAEADVAEADAEQSDASQPQDADDEGIDLTVSGGVEQALASICDQVVLEKVDTVGPAVGNELKRDALKSVGCALLFIIAYLWFRFELKFALGAVAALVHDVLITLGLFAIFGRQLSLAVVAAILTIIGYSLNDTIVVFDRIREDLRLYRGRGLSFSEIMDLSINQTLSRTLLTSATTLFVVVILFIFGGAVINDFAFALIVGIVVGTYSSIFVASPVVYFWEKWFGKQSLVIATGEGRRAAGNREEAVEVLVDKVENGDDNGDESATTSRSRRYTAGTGGSKSKKKRPRR